MQRGAGAARSIGLTRISITYIKGESGYIPLTNVTVYPPDCPWVILRCNQRTVAA